MSLFESKVTYKTYEMLEQMVELSKMKRSMYKNSPIEMYAVSFSFGRRSGHTEAVAKYVIENLGKEKFVVIVYNQSMKQHFLRLLSEYKVNVYSETDMIRVYNKVDVYLDRLRGIDLSDKIVIVDSHHINDILLSSHLVSSCKAFVQIGS